MSIEIREERRGDEEAIDRVLSQAFGAMDESHIVRLLREYYPMFDRRYSVTAWDSGGMVGHVLFTPARIRLMGETVPALAVGPVAVAPAWQRRGIGAEMLRFGHAMARADGFAFAFLQGHPSYYPRHGYVPAGGTVTVTLDQKAIPRLKTDLLAMPVEPADVSWLVSRWEAEFGNVDLAWLWGTALSEWSLPAMNAVMWWTEGGRRAGYSVGPPGETSVVIGDDPVLARAVLATVRGPKLQNHPSGWLARNVLDPAWSTCTVEPRKSHMAIDLADGALQPYLRAVEAGTRVCGATVFPLPFLAC